MFWQLHGCATAQLRRNINRNIIKLLKNLIPAVPKGSFCNAYVDSAEPRISPEKIGQLNKKVVYALQFN